ncbi:hypothetical protein KFE94_12090 [bacterium SCSIO 12643]|nr:hypothetical protein KFE94_12090 [bacterium SCSIO 12643]
MEDWKDYLVLVTAASSIGFGFWSNLQNRAAHKANRKDREARQKLLETEKKRANQNELALKIVERIVSIFAAIRNIRDPRYDIGPTYWRITQEDYPIKHFLEEYKEAFDSLKSEQLNLELDSLRVQVLLGEKAHKAIDWFQFYIHDFINDLQALEYEETDEVRKREQVSKFRRTFNKDPASEFNQELMKRIKGVFTELSPFLDENLGNFEHFRGYGVKKETK